MVALRKTYYGGNRVEGEHFDADPKHVRLLTATKAAKVREPESKRQYNRRDMRAKD